MNTIAGIVGARLRRPAPDVAAVDAAIDPDLPIAEHAALLILALLAGATPDTATATVEAVAALADQEGDRPAQIVGRLLDALIHLEKDVCSLAYASTVSAVLGDGLSVVIRFDTTDGPEEMAFTDDGGRYAPFRDQSVAIGLTVSGKVLFWLARDLAEIVRPVERRFFAATWGAR